MGKLQSPKSMLRRCTWEAVALTLVLCVAPASSRGQAGVEAAGADASSAGITAAITKGLPVSLPHLGADTPSPYIPAGEGPRLDEVNRKALEQRAGKVAAQVLLQSVPSEAMIHVDGMLVGRTPLLLIVPPGKYKVEMRGLREEAGESVIELSPNETQRLTLTLALRYPSSISVQTGRALPPSGVTAAGTKVLPASALPHPVKENDSTYRAALEGPSSGEANRRALEQRAGKDAAKLNLQSAPSEALTYVNGVFVGRTPLLLIVPPGKYKVEMRGKREEVGERLVGLLPNETQDLAFTLASRYPARISVP